MRRVAIIASGNELLHGRTVDTNSSYICSRLFPLDLSVVMIMVAGDDAVELERTLRYALDQCDIVILTGGLGPTDDDRTVETVQRIFGLSIVLDGTARDRMEAFYAKIGIQMADNDLKMVEIPAGATVLPNEKGLAPGFLVSRHDKILIALPGVPLEAAEMFDRSVLPYLKYELGLGIKASMYFRVIGMKETDINASVVKMNLPLDRLDWGITAQEGVTTVTFVAKDGTTFDSTMITGEAERIFRERYLDGTWQRPEEEVMAILRRRGLSLAAAESCTGGLISKRITDIPGASDVFIGSVIAYGNSVKKEQLGVSGEDLDMHGAVSPEVASSMASGVRSRLGADIGISTTGIAGPGGGSEIKPVGTVWFGLSDKNGTSSTTHVISGDRERVRSWASLIAIENLRTYLKQSEK